MRRLVIAAAVGAAVVGTAVPSLASQGSAPGTTLPVGVTYSTNGGVFVGTTINGQPGAGAYVANGRACVGISYEVPFCQDVPPVTVTALPKQINVGPASVYVDTTNGVAVGTALGSQPLVGVWVANGKVCVGFSEEIPFCVGVPPITGPAAAPRQQLPVVLYHDDTRTVVGVDDIGVVIYSNGRICPVVSTQDWQCIPADLG
jgi:hypothetical protein